MTPLGDVISSRLHSLHFQPRSSAGLGFALCYTPAIVMVGCYFRERKALAYGVAMSGSGIGTFVLAPAVQLLIDMYSWRGALLILSAFVSNLCVCGALLRPIATQETKEAEAVEKERFGKRRRCKTSYQCIATVSLEQSECRQVTTVS